VAHLIEKYVDVAFLEAKERTEGRVLLICTTNLDGDII